jgi:CheY-like chemotaxis protein
MIRYRYDRIGAPYPWNASLPMPEMDGFEFLRHLRVRPDRRDVPVIVLTVKILTAAENAELRAMTQRVVAKGQGAHLELTRAVRSVLEPV